MADHEGTAHSEQAPGGRSSRGPEFGTGGEPQVPVPPYDDERGEPGENTAPAAYDASNAPAPAAGAPVSDEERSGMSGTETAPEPPLGVGRSRGSRGEDLAPERDDVDTEGAAERPVGRAAQDDSDSVGQQGPVDDAPNLQTGDQGG